MCLVLEEAHLRALVDGGVDAGCEITLVDVFRRRRRPWIAWDCIDPPAVRERVVCVHIVCLPESACVRRHGVAPDRDPVPDDPRRDRDRRDGEHKEREPYGSLVDPLTPEQEADDDERKCGEADVAENSESEREPEHGGDAHTRTIGRHEGQEHDRRGEEVVEDFPVHMNVVPDEIRM